MKKTSLLALLAIVILAGAAVLQQREIQQLEALVENQELLAEQLSDQLELNISERRDYESQIASLEDNLAAVTSQLDRVSQSLQQAREQSLPPAANSEPAAASDRPDNAAMVARTMTGDVQRQMALMQINVRYGEFLNELGAAAARLDQIRDLMAAVFVERTELSMRMTSGGASSTDLERVSSPDYMRQRLATLLTGPELAQFDDYETTNANRQLRNSYDNQVSRFAPALSPDHRALVVDTMVRHMQENSLRDNPGLAANELVNRQLQSLARARQELRGALAAEQMAEAERFLSQVQSSLEMSRAMNESMNGR